MIATTLLDAEVYTADSIAMLYRQRWQVELDLRSLKTHMQMDRLRCKTPSMVRKEIYCHMLAYNVVRSTIVESSLIFDKRPCQISFTGAMQYSDAFLSAVAARGRIWMRNIKACSPPFRLMKLAIVGPSRASLSQAKTKNLISY